MGRRLSPLIRYILIQRQFYVYWTISNKEKKFNHETGFGKEQCLPLIVVAKLTLPSDHH